MITINTPRTKQFRTRDGERVEILKVFEENGPNGFGYATTVFGLIYDEDDVARPGAWDRLGCNKMFEYQKDEQLHVIDNLIPYIQYSEFEIDDLVEVWDNFEHITNIGYYAGTLELGGCYYPTIWTGGRTSVTVEYSDDRMSYQNIRKYVK